MHVLNGDGLSELALGKMVPWSNLYFGSSLQVTKTVKGMGVGGEVCV